MRGKYPTEFKTLSEALKIDKNARLIALCRKLGVMANDQFQLLNEVKEQYNKTQTNGTT